jgi:hypothetical protein
VQHRHRGVSDPDQAWLLGELIAYLDHEKSGASGFQDMGDKWVSVRTAAANETLRAGDPEAREIAERWEQFIDYMCLGLGQDLGREVTPVRPRKTSAEARLDATVRRLVDAGKLDGSVRVPDAIGDVSVEADLRTRRVTTSVRVAAPREGRPKTRINWMLRHCKDRRAGRGGPTISSASSRCGALDPPRPARLCIRASQTSTTLRDLVEPREHRLVQASRLRVTERRSRTGSERRT